MNSRRRALVLSDESARHPFLATLPPHVRRGDAAETTRTTWWRDFLMAYCASLVVVAIYIA